MVFDDQYAQTEPGTIVEQYPSNDTNSQVWLLSAAGEVSFVIANSDNVITTFSSSFTLQNLRQYNQNWEVASY